MGKSEAQASTALDNTVDPPGMYAGVEGRGAQDAAFSAALEVEWARVMNSDLTGGSVDIYKCFDQFVRPPVYHILRKA